MQSLLLKAAATLQQSESNTLTYVASGVVVALGIAAYLVMSAPSQPAGPAAAAAPATPVRVSEGTPNPERTFTLAQLKAYDGSNLTGPIYMGCAGKVFDVTGGASFYGPGGAYGGFAGTDASRGLAKMDLKPSSYAVDDLGPAETNTLKEWCDKFESKYPIVGKIVDYSQANSGPKPADGVYTQSSL